MSTLKYLALAAVLAVASGCDDDDAPAKVDAALTLDGAAPGPDGGVVADGAVNPDVAVTVSLVDFVTGLVTGSTNATSAPASLDDKTITDTTDPTAFDQLIGQ